MLVRKLIKHCGEQHQTGKLLPQNVLLSMVATANLLSKYEVRHHLARYCQEQKILGVFIFQQQIFTFICRILRNSSSLYILYFYKELGFNLLEIRFLKRISTSEKIFATKGAVSRLFGRDPFHSFTRLKLLLLSLISDTGISGSAPLNFFLHSNLERTSSIKNASFP